MSHRPFSRHEDGFRPWKRDGAHTPRREHDTDRPRGRDAEFDARGNFRNDNVWRSDTAHRAAEPFPRRPLERREGDRRGDDRDRRGFAPRPWERRGEDRGGGDTRDRGPDQRPWERRGEDRRGGDTRDRGPDHRPWERREGDRRGEDRRGGDTRDRGFAPRPWERRGEERGGDRDRGPDRRPWGRREDPRSSGPGPRVGPRPEKRRFPESPKGELIYGRQPVRELLLAQQRGVRELILADGVKSSEEITAIEALCLERAIPIQRFDRETLDAWLNAANHQGVLAVCAEYRYADFHEILTAVHDAEENALVVLLDHVVDPQNLGSLLRSCEAAGVLGVVIPADRAVGVTPAAVRASAGAAEHLRVAIVPSLVGAIEKLKDKEGRVWITGLESSEEAKPYTELDFKGKVALVIGSEGAGLTRLVREHCDFLAKLPMFGKVGSLNAGVAGALALYEVLRQQERK